MFHAKSILTGFISLLLLALLNCGASPGTGNAASLNSSDPTDNRFIQFQFDGAAWVSGPPGHPEMNFEEEAITDGSTMVRIEGYAQDQSNFALTIYQATGIGTGTYPITDQGMQGFLKFKEQGGINYVTNGMPDNPGSVTITELTDEKVVGTFQFRMRSAGNPDDIKELTAGSFDLRFTTY